MTTQLPTLYSFLYQCTPSTFPYTSYPPLAYHNFALILHHLTSTNCLRNHGGALRHRCTHCTHFVVIHDKYIHSCTLGDVPTRTPSKHIHTAYQERPVAAGKCRPNNKHSRGQETCWASSSLQTLSPLHTNTSYQESSHTHKQTQCPPFSGKL